MEFDKETLRKLVREAKDLAVQVAPFAPELSGAITVGLLTHALKDVTPEHVRKALLEEE